MVSAQSHTQTCTPQQYLEFERSAEFKHEYLDGVIYAMSGGSPEHSTITVNVSGELRTHLKGRPCQAFSNDMKVRTDPSGLFAYPDVSVVCGEPQFHDERRDVLINPTIIFEVLSPSTEAFDRGRKFFQYRQFASLVDYVLIAQDEPCIDHYTRQAEDHWLLSTVTGLTNSLYLASIDCTLALAEVYDRITFPAQS